MNQDLIVAFATLCEEALRHEARALARGDLLAAAKWSDAAELFSLGAFREARA